MYLIRLWVWICNWIWFSGFLSMLPSHTWHSLKRRKVPPLPPLLSAIYSILVSFLFNALFIDLPSLSYHNLTRSNTSSCFLFLMVNTHISTRTHAVQETVGRISLVATRRNSCYCLYASFLPPKCTRCSPVSTSVYS